MTAPTATAATTTEETTAMPETTRTERALSLSEFLAAGEPTGIAGHVSRIRRAATVAEVAAFTASAIRHAHAADPDADTWPIHDAANRRQRILTEASTVAAEREVARARATSAGAEHHLNRTDDETDMVARFRPSPSQERLAALLLAPVIGTASESEWFALVPLALPGKDWHVWQTGQPVVAVAGGWLARNEPTNGAPGPYDYGWARNQCDAAAEAYLAAAGETGTTAYVAIGTDGAWHVYGG